MLGLPPGHAGSHDCSLESSQPPLHIEDSRFPVYSDALDAECMLRAPPSDSGRRGRRNTGRNSRDGRVDRPLPQRMPTEGSNAIDAKARDTCLTCAPTPHHFGTRRAETSFALDVSNRVIYQLIVKRSSHGVPRPLQPRRRLCQQMQQRNTLQ